MIKDYFTEILINDVHNVDFIHGVKLISDNSINCVITDPPYRCISGGRPHKKGQPSGMLSSNNGKNFEFNSIKPEEWFPEIYRILKPNSHCYIMCNTINLENYLKLSKDTGFNLHNILVWHKNNVTPSRWYMKNAEFTLFLRKGKAKPINNISSKMIHSFKNILGNKLHPTEKPIELMEFYLLNSTNENDIVFDPFCGSGSTLIAALKNNRKYIGFEIDQKYYEVALNRIYNFEKEVN